MKTIRLLLTILALSVLSHSVLAQNIPLYTESWSFSDEMDTSVGSNNYGNSNREALYIFTVSQHSIIVVSNAGSELSETSIGLSLECSLSQDTGVARTWHADGVSVDGTNEAYLAKMQRFYPQWPAVYNALETMPSGQGFLCAAIPPGVYELYCEGSGKETPSNGVIRTDIHVYQLGGSMDEAIEICPTELREEHASCSRTGAPNEVYYKLTFDEPYCFSFSNRIQDNAHPMPRMRMELLDHDGNNIDHLLENSLTSDGYPMISAEALPSDSYFLKTVFDGDGVSLVDTEIEIYRFPVISPSTGFHYWNAINLGVIQDTLAHDVHVDTRGYEDRIGENGISEAYYRFTAESPFRLKARKATTYGSEATLFIKNSSDYTKIIADLDVSRNWHTSEIYFHAGSYYLILEGKNKNDIFDWELMLEHVEIPEPDPVPFNPDMMSNHIVTEIPVDMISDPDSMKYSDARRVVDYYDALGRPVQSVTYKGAPDGNDMLSFHYGYDLHGRQDRTWLAAALGRSSGAEAGIEDVKAATASAYRDSMALSVTSYSEDGLDRISSLRGAGEEWAEAGKAVTKQYTTDILKRYHAFAAENGRVLRDCGTYVSGDLNVEVTTDEDGHTSRMFKDRTGKTLCEEAGGLKTYYVYDTFGNLCFVLPPMTSGQDITEEILDKFAYQYRYDRRNLMTGKKLPGADWTEYVYDGAEQLVLSRDGEQRTRGEWTFYVNDIFGRQVLSGKYQGDRPSIDRVVVRAYKDDGPDGYRVENLDMTNAEIRQIRYYDGYSFLSLDTFAESSSYEAASGYGERFGSDSDPMCSKGLLTGSVDRYVETDGLRWTAYYYDEFKRCIQTRSGTSSGQRSDIFRRYSFNGELLESLEVNRPSEASLPDTLHKEYEYDLYGRLIEETSALNGVGVSSDYSYDMAGRQNVTTTSIEEGGSLTIGRTYNVRGWITGISSDPFSATLRYLTPALYGSEASFTGNISEWEWTRGEHGDTKAYSFDYDNLSRMTGSRLLRNNALTDAISEKNISYDSNGNILSLTRTGEDGSAVNDLSYHYDGNRLASLSDRDVLSQNYSYDADGNMTFDGRTGMSLEWNDLGLVEKVSLNDTVLVNYSYLADGTKVSALDNEGNGLLYLGSLIYRKTGSNISLESTGFAGGRFVAKETSPGVSAMVPMIHVT
ncbi:MAG: RHS repeat protein, partial [Bacteroidales bacterium]|nr:RHS repeat protein [Bacteroidales bacterium]